MTTILPVVALFGTGTVILPSLQLVGVPATPLKVTVLVPCVEPKFVPKIVTGIPGGPLFGLRLLMFGVTVNVTALLAKAPTLTTTPPVVAPGGTRTTMLVALQLCADACVPLKVIVLGPCVAPKVVPVMVTELATGPDVGERLVMLGTTVKGTPLLVRPPTVTLTLTFPGVAVFGTGTMMLVSLQLAGVAAVPLKATELVPCVAPKLVPVMVTEVPTFPDVGERLVMLGPVIVMVEVADFVGSATDVAVSITVGGLGTVGGAVYEVVVLPVAGPSVPQALPEHPAPVSDQVTPKFAVSPCTVAAYPTEELILREGDAGDTLTEIGRTVKFTPLLETPPTVTTTLPLAAPLGTGTVMEVKFQKVGVASVPANETVLEP